MKNLKFFSIMGPRDTLSCSPEVTTQLTADQLTCTPLEGEDDVFIGSMNNWILFYDGMTLLQGDVHTANCTNLMEKLGVSYQA